MLECFKFFRSNLLIGYATDHNSSSVLAVNRYLKHELIRLFWPKIFLRSQRQALKEELLTYTVNDRKANHQPDSSWLVRKLKALMGTRSVTAPIEPWAFVRVHNEARTLEACLDSIAKVFKKGVLAHHGSTDGSVEIMERFCKTHPGFFVFHYPHVPYPANHEAYKNKVPYEKTLAGYYDAVMKQIPEGEWVMKIDVDQYYFEAPLKYALSLPQDEGEAVSFGRINLVIDNDGKRPEDFKVLNYVEPGDHWLICNRNIQFAQRTGTGSDGEFFSFEHARFKRAIISAECHQLHFPFEKSWRTNPKGDFETFEAFMAKADPNKFDPTLFTIENVMSVYRSFKA